MQRKASSGIIFALLLGILTLTAASALVTNASAWSNGGYSSDPTNPDYGTHDWIAQHALDWLPTQEKQYILDNLATYLYGTELPDNNQAPDGIGDTTKHHIYYNSAEVMTDDAAAVRASTEYENARNFLIAKDFAQAAKNAGIMSHYIADMAVFGHVMGSGTDWGTEVHHTQDYEPYVNARTSSYSTEFNSYLAFDGTLATVSAYDAAKNLAYDTTFDVDGDLTCVWMDQNYDWNNPTFKNRAGESLNLAVNYVTDVLHTLYWASIPDEAYITTVPHHPQINSYYCGPASLEMVFDFYGPDIPQLEIADVARTAPDGTYTCDMIRAAHFSNLSTSVGNAMSQDITGYTARKLGYAAFEYGGMTIDELKSLIAAGYPIIVLTTWHFRVAMGYNNIHITFQDSYYGKMYNMTYAAFDVDWDYSGHWALLISPWKIELSTPQHILHRSIFNVTANIAYPLLPPFYSGQYPASSSNATLTLPLGLSLAAGETAKKTIGTGDLSAGASANVKWRVSANTRGSYIIGVETEGKVEGFLPPLPSYPQPYSYMDRIGGAQQITVQVAPADETPPVTVDDYDDLWHTDNFTITLTSTDSQSGVAETYYKINDGSVKTVSADEQPIITDESADNKLEYWSVDNDGNEETHHILTGIKLDKTAPLGSITINNGQTYTTSTSVTLTLTAADATSGVYQIRYSNDGIWDTEPWETPSQSKTWTLTSADGTKIVYYQIKDNAGLSSTTYSDTIILDSTPPTGLITINEGATYATTVTVTLSPYATDATSGIAEMRFSNDNTTYTEWQTYTTSRPWTLPNSDGAKTVYVEFKDHSGLVSKTYTDTIILDTTRPTGSIKIAEDATYTNSPSVVLTLSAEDATSGIAKMRFSNDTATWTPWEAYSTSKTWTLTTQDETKKVYAQFRDKAGLTSQTNSDAIILDATPPTIKINKPNQGSETKSSTLTVTWIGSDATSGISRYEIRLDGGTWTDIETDTAYTFSGLADGTHTVDVKATDKAGNTKQETISFTVNTSPLFGLSYTELAVITAAIIIAAIGTGTYLLKTKKRKAKRLSDRLPLHVQLLLFTRQPQQKRSYYYSNYAEVNNT